jgi:hypothetical protein
VSALTQHLHTIFDTAAAGVLKGVRRKKPWGSPPPETELDEGDPLARFKTQLTSYLPPKEVEAITRAYDYSAQAHVGQLRISGEPYISHPLAVADTLARWRLDPNAVMAALLHDVMEDTTCTKEDIAERFGKTTAELVDGVSKLDRLEGQTYEEAQAENFRKMLLAMARDVRVILIKLADRRHNMQTLGAMSKEKQRRIARETLDIYAPIANRLGLNALYRELQELSFEHAYPVRHRVLTKAVKQARGNRREVVGKILDAVRKVLPESGIEAEVMGREKACLRHLPQDARKASEFFAGARYLWLSHCGQGSAHLLPRSRHFAQPLPTGTGQVQGLHRDPQGQRLPVFAHHTDWSLWHAGRNADSYLGDASCG